MSPAALQLSGIAKSYGGVVALKGVDLTVRPGAILGLVGQNGAGKSTMMNVIGGVVTPSAGAMHLFGAPYMPRGPADAAHHGVAFIHQELNLFPNLSIVENMFIAGAPTRFGAIDWRQAKSEARALLQRLGVAFDPDTPLAALSPGERQLVEIAKALKAKARLIILDEPTTSLTEREASRLFTLMRALRDEGAALIFISHALGDVLGLCDDVAVLRDGEVVATGRAKDFDMPRLITSMIGRTLDAQFPHRPPPAGGAPAVLDVKDLAAPGVRRASLTLAQGEVLGLFGLMGAGRTELARAIFGLAPRRGAVRVGGAALKGGSPRLAIEAGLAFVTEDRRGEGLMMNASVRNNLALAVLDRFARRLGVVDDRAVFAACDRVAKDLQVKGADAPAVKNLSGGNQQKVVLGKWLLREPKALLLDEPTRGVDVGAKYEIYAAINALLSRGMGVLMISSDIDEAIGMSDRILVMSRGALVAEFSPPFSKDALLQAAFQEEGVRAAG